MSYSRELGDVHESTIAAGRIRYRATGSGDPIVFIHGIIANGDLWRGVVPHLASDHRCVTPDWPLGAHEVGLGAAADFSLPGLARMVADFLDAEDLRDVTIVANDTGGAIAQWLVVHHVERLRRVVLTPCDAFDNFLPPVLRHLYATGRYAPQLRMMGESLRWRRVQRMPIAFGWTTVRPIDPRAMASYVTPLRRGSGTRRDFAKLVRGIDARYTQAVAERLPEARVEARVIWARHDRLFPLAHATRLAELLGAGAPLVIEDSAAFIPEDQPLALAQAVAAFMGDDRRSSVT